MRDNSAPNSIFGSCLQKQQGVLNLFIGCEKPEQKYEKLIALGRQLEPYPIEYQTNEHIVKGCQSAMYLHARLIEGKVLFRAHSDALISAGLAALLLAVYHGESPETILGCPPRYLEELDLYRNLTPGRSNGLASLFQRMKQEALNFLISSTKFIAFHS